MTGWIGLCRFALVSGIAIAAALAQQDTAGTAPGGGLRRTEFRDISSSQTFNHINRNDARAAVKAWFDVVGQQKGFLLDSKVDIVDSVAEVRERLLSHSVELVMMGITDYLELESSHLVVPVLTDLRTGQTEAAYSYVLLVNPSARAISIAAISYGCTLIPTGIPFNR